MDFLKIGVKPVNKDRIVIFPNFIIKKSKDLMIRGGDFYAIWDEENGVWSTEEDDVIRLVDDEIRKFVNDHPEYNHASVMYMIDSDSGMIDKWHKYCQKQLRDNYHPLNENLTFANTPINKKDYASKRLGYSLVKQDTPAWDELVSTLYSPEERHKIEWAIGSIVNGDSKTIQKFLVFYGAAGTGKSTILNIIQQLFEGYYCMFDAKALGSSNDAFALEPFKVNPLVAIQHDGDLSRIEDNTRLNSVVSHEQMTVNEKFTKLYTNSFRAMLFMGTNRPVKITDSKSGIIRRLIDVHPTEQRLPIRKYRSLMSQIPFELGGIAEHCKEVYEEDKYFYDNYIPLPMLSATNDFYNFMEDRFFIFNQANETTLSFAWNEYKDYCDEARVPYPMMKRIFKEELKTYFEEYKDRGTTASGEQVYNLYVGFKASKFSNQKKIEEDNHISNWLDLKEQKSIFDVFCQDCPAQYANDKESPSKKWDSVETTLKDIDTKVLHYVRVPENHIVIDFDIKDEEGNKSFEKNVEAASKWPRTYSEVSKSGKGIHLHYIYDGDVSKLSRVYDDNIEIKVFSGKSALRRRLSCCNNLPIQKINSGLPLKGANKVVNFETVKNEKAIRTILNNCLKKQHHGATKPEVDFIYKTLEEAYNSGTTYDVTDLRPKILSFANNSSNNSNYCVGLVAKMHFCSDEKNDDIWVDDADKPIAFYDVEVFCNLFVVCYKLEGPDNPVIKMINPGSGAVTEFVDSYRLVGFNNRRYDNHILYARMLGYSNEELFMLSQKIVNGSSNCYFSEAYNLSYTDIYDFASTKQSLKKWEIELNIHHQELGLPWDEPVPEDMWEKVADYCTNDVIATEAVFNARHDDFLAREILADISGLSINDTTNRHTTQLIVGGDKDPQKKFVYTDLSKMFPGYKFDKGKSIYRGEEVGEGGYVYSEPGMYENVALLDIASMHPNSAINLDIFGPYTKNFSELVQARLCIKPGDYDEAGKLFDGKLQPYLKDKNQAKSLSYALKIAINSVYGLTAAKFDNKLRDPRNIDNIVAKRGALFMIDLKHEVQKHGYTVAHIKTDSIKIPNADEKIISFVCEFGKKYGYTFEHEATYSRLCLVNDAVYIAKDASDGHWTATGTQFQVPFVFKTLFSHEPIIFKDLCETKTVTTALYLDMNENLPDGEHNYVFIGKAGLFCPIKSGRGGGILLREKDGKYSAATGTKGYRWLEAETIQNLNREDDIDKAYYINLVDEAVASISEYGDFEWFIS